MAGRKIFGLYENKSLAEIMSKEEINKKLEAVEKKIDTNISKKVTDLEEKIQEDIAPKLNSITGQVEGLEGEVDGVNRNWNDFKINQESELATFKGQIGSRVSGLETDKENKADADAARGRISALESGKLDKGASGSVSLAMLSQEVKTAMTGGSVAVVGEDAVLTENLTDKAVTPGKTSFFREVASSGEVENLFNGRYERYYLTGTNGAMKLSANDKGKCAVIPAEPNTSYSIATNIQVLMKVASSSALVEVGGSFDGAINVNVGTTQKSLRVTGPNDKYLYISLTNPASDSYSDEEVFLKVVPSASEVLPEEGETYPASSSNLFAASMLYS